MWMWYVFRVERGGRMRLSQSTDDGDDDKKNQTERYSRLGNQTQWMRGKKSCIPFLFTYTTRRNTIHTNICVPSQLFSSSVFRQSFVFVSFIGGFIHYCSGHNHTPTILQYWKQFSNCSVLTLAFRRLRYTSKMYVYAYFLDINQSQAPISIHKSNHTRISSISTIKNSLHYTNK